MAQKPPEQDGVPSLEEQTLPQLPQLLTSFSIETHWSRFTVAQHAYAAPPGHARAPPFRHPGTQSPLPRSHTVPG